MIIVEGPDCAGKSTLCSLLSAVLKLDIIHLSNKSDNSYKAYLQRIEDMAKKPVIYDRFFFSEAVYSQILKRERAFSDSEYVDLKNKLHDNAIQVIHCTREDSILLERYKTRGEDFVTRSELINISNCFWDHFRYFNATIIELDIMNFTKFLDQAQEFVDRLHGTKINNE